MYLNAHIKVVIADKTLQTVVSVAAKNDAQHIGGSCDLIVPLNCRIQYNNGDRGYLTDIAKNLFKSGDPIMITAWYDGYEPLVIFQGYVYDFIEGNPCTIKCLDAVYFFNQGLFGNKRLTFKTKKRNAIKSGIGASYTSITLKNLLQNIVDYVNDTIDESSDTAPFITLQLPIFELTLENISFVAMSPASILEWLKKELGVNISLSGTQLYCNIASNTIKTVEYSTDRNVIKSDLQKPDATFQRLKLKAWFLREDGTKDSFEVGDQSGELREVFFYKVTRDAELYRKLANEALLKYKQHKYSGTIETYLYPDLDLFWKADYVDIRYPDRTGGYVVQSIETNCNEAGYHRKVKLAFLVDTAA